MPLVVLRIYMASALESGSAPSNDCQKGKHFSSAIGPPYLYCLPCMAEDLSAHSKRLIGSVAKTVQRCYQSELQWIRE